MNSLILASAGCGSRMKAGINKLFLEFGGHPLIYYTLSHVFASKLLSELIIVARPEEYAFFENILKAIPHSIPVRFAPGGEERIDSIVNGMRQIAEKSRKVLIHDGARPLVDGKVIDQAFSSITEESPAVAVCIPSVDTIKQSDGNHIISTLDRNRIYRAQTPQGGFTSLYRKALCSLKSREGITDDASVFEKYGVPVKIIPGKEKFFKVTCPEDRKKLEGALETSMMPIRIGQGYDIHQIAEDRPLILGGVRISEKNGLLGHSDADALVHAIMDSILGAAGLPDIGHFFPDDDPKFLGADSLKLLRYVGEKADEAGYSVGNLDSTIIAERPKMAPHIHKMKENIAEALHIELNQVNIKATTNENLGPIGKGLGIAALASVILFRRNSNGE